ncbi:MAG: J domain-containing protein [Desulfatiglandaceae bacterium]
MVKMNKYQKIYEARVTLDLSETATMASIKSNYRRLLERWHPDKCGGNKEECTRMTRKIISAYDTIMDYCANYQYSFGEEAIKRQLSPEEWWFERFGNDPLWGNTTKQK